MPQNAFGNGVLAALANTTPAAAPDLSADMQNFAANQTVIVAFATAAGAALDAAAAWLASVAGGKHRKDGTSFDKVVPSMFRR